MYREYFPRFVFSSTTASSLLSAMNRSVDACKFNISFGNLFINF